MFNKFAALSIACVFHEQPRADLHGVSLPHSEPVPVIGDWGRQRITQRLDPGWLTDVTRHRLAGPFGSIFGLVPGNPPAEAYSTAVPNTAMAKPDNPRTANAIAFGRPSGWKQAPLAAMKACIA